MPPDTGRYWTLWRQDDNGNRFLVTTAPTGREIQRSLVRLVDAGHKQLCWVEPPPILPQACQCDAPDRHCGGPCVVCGRPGHLRQHPAPLPASYSWCNEHYVEIAESCRRCLICRDLAYSADDSFVAWGPDEFAHYEVAPLHWECFEGWADRHRFGSGYLAAWVASSWRTVHADERLALLVHPGDRRNVALVIAQAPMAVKVPIEHWGAFLRDPSTWTQPQPAVHHLQRRALELAAAEVAHRFPTAAPFEP